ncbi:hypothetical protein [Cellulomonas fengjieae]|uniref:Lipoprotein n=1 Tax=Cellulomonas fengjieae TaxID=2819978 RepID=A0ABS3SM21_9CELL|nr:hypothetical protein [Cellulomonas fengjieae]MBO3086534.1 hypothetical protein [Cellulomonas fengjieae]QVI66609.1 hypothetical protein KG102_03120 [Cellulomonas fengjieae]
MALTTTAGLAGCAGQPGAAAVVDGTAIPTADVGVALTELMPYFEGVTTTNVLAVLVQEPTVVELAEENGVGVSDQDAHDLLDQVVEQKVAGLTATFSEPSVAVARYSIAFTNLQGLPEAAEVGEEIESRLQALDVEINPRFGSIEDGNQVVAPVPVPWLVGPQAPAPSDEATPEPAPSAP